MQMGELGLWWFMGGDFYDIRQHHQITNLQETSIDQAVNSSNRFGQLEDQVARQALLIDVLGRLLITKNIITRQELAVMTQQVDLEDGIEDGRIGPNRTAEAPACSNCGRAVNPRRKTCVFCKHEIDFKDGTPAPRPLVACSSCGKQVEEHQSFLSETGIQCNTCFYR